MRSKGMTANVISFTADISAYAKGEQWEQALTALHKVRETGVTAYMIRCTVIPACDKAGPWVSAAMFARE